MSEAIGAVTEGAEAAAEGADQAKESQLVSQADVDRIVKERVARERAKYADYEDLKAKAAGSKTLEERLASLEGELTTAKATALRSDIAAKHGLSAEDRDLFLTGTDESTLTAQAQRLAGREADRKKQGNLAPKEGNTPAGGTNTDEREFARSLFGRAD
jgi:hypothetical protein